MYSIINSSNADDVLSAICWIRGNEVRISTTIIVFGTKRNKIPKLTKENLLFSFTFESLFNNHSNLEDITHRIKSYLMSSFPCALNRGNSIVIWNIDLNEDELKFKLETELMEKITLWGSTTNKIMRTEKKIMNTLNMFAFNKLIIHAFGLP